MAKEQKEATDALGARFRAMPILQRVKEND